MKNNTVKNIFFIGIVLSFSLSISVPPLSSFIEEYISSIVIMILFACTARRDFISISKLTVALFVFFFLAALVSFLNETSTFNLVEILLFSSIVTIASVVCYSLYVEDKSGYAKVMAKALLAIFFVQSVSAVLIYYQLLPVGVLSAIGGGSSRMTGWISQSNLLAILIALGISSIIFLSKNEKQSPFFQLALVIAGYIGAGTGSRMFIIFAVLLVLFYGKKSIAAMLRVILGFLIFILINDSVIKYLGIDINSTSAIERASSGFDIRMSEFIKAFYLFFDNPLLGIGYGNYVKESFWLTLDHSNLPNNKYYGLFHHSHNIYSQVAAEFGIFPLLAVVFLSLLILIKYYFAIVVKRNSSSFYSSSSAIILNNSLLEYSLWYYNFAILFVFLITPLFDDKNQFKIKRVKSSIVFMVFAVFISVSFILLQNYIKTITVYFSKHLDSADIEYLSSDTRRVLFPIQNYQLLLYHLGPNIVYVNNADKITSLLAEQYPNNLTVAARVYILIVKGDEIDIVIARRYTQSLIKHYPNTIKSWLKLYEEQNDSIIKRSVLYDIKNSGLYNTVPDIDG